MYPNPQYQRSEPTLSVDSGESYTGYYLFDDDVDKPIHMCCCCCYYKTIKDETMEEENNNWNSRNSTDEPMEEDNSNNNNNNHQKSPGMDDLAPTTVLACHWGRCCRNVFISWVLLGALVIFIFYVVLPIVLTSYMNTASITFQNVAMSDDHNQFMSSFSAHNSSLSMSATCRLEHLSIPVDVGIVVQTLNVYHKGIAVGHLVPEEKEITVYQSLGGNFSLPAQLQIHNMSAFHAFASDLLDHDHVQWDLVTEGAGASIRLRIPLSPLYYVHGSHSESYWDVYVPGVKFNKSVLMTGCNGFHNTSLELFTLDDEPNAKFLNQSGLNVHIAAKIYNPSFANVTNMGVVRFDMSFAPKGAVGEASVGHQELGYLLTDGPLSVAPGWNIMRASGRFIAEGQYADVLIQKFLAGEPNRLMAKAPPTGASSDPLFSQFVGGLSIETTLKGVTTGLVTQGVLLLTPSVIAQMLNPFRGKKPVIVPTTIQLTNPFGARLDITRVEMEVIINDTIVVGRAIQKNMNITVPRYVEGWYGWYGLYGWYLVIFGGTGGWWY